MLVWCVDTEHSSGYGCMEVNNLAVAPPSGRLINSGSHICIGCVIIIFNVHCFILFYSFQGQTYIKKHNSICTKSNTNTYNVNLPNKLQKALHKPSHSVNCLKKV